MGARSPSKTSPRATPSPALPSLSPTATVSSKDASGVHPADAAGIVPQSRDSVAALVDVAHCTGPHVAVFWHPHGARARLAVWRGRVTRNRVRYDAELTVTGWALMKHEDGSGDDAVVDCPWPPKVVVVRCWALPSPRVFPVVSFPLSIPPFLSKNNVKTKQSKEQTISVAPTKIQKTQETVSPPLQQGTTTETVSPILPQRSTKTTPPRTIQPSASAIGRSPTTLVPPAPRDAQQSSPTRIAAPVPDSDDDADEDLFAVFRDPAAPAIEFDVDTEYDTDDDEPADKAIALAELAASPPDLEALGFRKGHGLVPPVALLTGTELLAAVRLPPATMPVLTVAALSHETRACHRRLLRLLASLPPPYRLMQISTAIVAYLSNEAQRRRWRHSTLLKYLCSTQGALGALPVYRRGSIPIPLGTCPIWRQSIRAAAAKARVELPRHPPRATRIHVVSALATTTSLPVRAAIAISWAVAGRVGDVLRLFRKDVQLEGSRLTVTYRHHKTLHSKGPYSVTTMMDAADAAHVAKWLLQRSTDLWCFPNPAGLGPAVRTALKSIDSSLEQRSLRRGALMLMAEKGVPESVLLEFSGHSSIKMLRRYLQWGAALQNRNESTAAAGQLLA